MSASAATNLENAQHSTGPKTEEGKERAKFNALKTGLFARAIVLPTEEQSAYDALGAFLTDHWDPQTDNERELVTDIQNTTWRLKRVTQLEISAYTVAAQQQLELINEKFPDRSPADRYLLAQGAAYLANSRAFDQLSKHEGRLQRALERATRDLVNLIAGRRAIAKLSAQPAPQTGLETPAPQNGFVPSKYPAHMPVFTGPHQREKRQRWLRQNGYKNLN